MKVKAGDMVLVRRGKDRGKTGKVIRVLPHLNKVIVEAVNVVKKAQKPAQKNPRGGISSASMPMAVANVGLVHPTDSKRSSRVGYRSNKDGKVRIYRQAEGKEIKT